MSFFESFKRAFGFGPDSDEYSDSDDSTGAEAAPDTSAPAAAPAEETPAPAIDADMRAAIFEGVVKIFNSALPDFLQRGVDPQAQQKALAESLDAGLTQYLDGLVARAEQHAESRLQASVEASRREAERLKTEMQQLEHQRSNIQEQQLSADRRRRALSERVTDLESRLAAADAEREQLQLENRSMMNKLKVADVQPGVVDDLTRQVEELTARLAEGGDSGDAARIAAERSAEIEKARAEAKGAMELAEAARAESAEAKAEAEAARGAEAEAREAAARLGEECDTMRQAIENLKEQDRMGQAMYNDMQEKYSAERTAREAAEHELSEARELLKAVDDMKEQFGQIEAVIRKRDERIEKLKATNRRLRDDISALKEQMTAMAGPNLFSGGDDGERGPDEETVREMQSYEDDFQCPDWFAREPDEEHSRLPRPDNDDFGYTEPPRKPRKPDSDAQMLLF